jgi:hypothetical protein
MHVIFPLMKVNEDGLHSIIVQRKALQEGPWCRNLSTLLVRRSHHPGFPRGPFTKATLPPQTQRAIPLAGGHMTEAPATLTYASLVSRESVRRVMLTIAALNDLQVKVPGTFKMLSSHGASHWKDMDQTWEGDWDRLRKESCDRACSVRTKECRCILP